MRKFIILAFILGGSLISLSAQQSITRFAVVDMNRIVAAFSDHSDVARAFSEKRDRIQADIERHGRELQELVDRLREAEAAERPNPALVQRLQRDITQKSQTIQNFIISSNAELERDRERFLRGEFMGQVNNIIRIVAEGEGFSMVLTRDAPGIIWHSPSIDITSRVIERIRSGGRR